MTSPLSYPAFRALFAAQVFSLIAVGLLTVALSLAAYAIGGVAAGGQVLGLLLALKMVAYVGLAPVLETALAGRPRKATMIGLDVARMALLLPMAFVSELWQIAVLAFAFFAVSAGFTPLFQAAIPDILRDETTYTKALSYSRLAYTAEAVTSPLIAAAMLSVLAPEHLFLCAALAFAVSIAALVVARFPEQVRAAGKGPFLKRALKGMTIYLHTPRLRGLVLLNFALSLAMAWVLVNSVVYAGATFGDAERFYPMLMACYGLGAAIGAVSVPPLIARIGERQVMIAGTMGFAALGATMVLDLGLTGSLILWAGFGLASSLVLTPGGLVITQSAPSEDRPAVFAAQFSLSHAGWLVAYPLAGFLAARVGLDVALVMLSTLCALVTLLAMRVWPASDRAEQLHFHPDLPADHPHLRDHPADGPQHQHEHVYHINALHPRWAEVQNG